MPRRLILDYPKEKAARRAAAEHKPTASVNAACATSGLSGHTSLFNSNVTVADGLIFASSFELSTPQSIAPHAVRRIVFAMLSRAGNPIIADRLNAAIAVDGRTFVGCANTPVSMGDGYYYIDLLDCELRGETATLLLRSSQGDAAFLKFIRHDGIYLSESP